MARNFTYRVDRAPKHEETPGILPLRYRVPDHNRGTVYLAFAPPSIHSVLETLSPKLAKDEVLIFSKWMDPYEEYCTAQVIEA